MITILDLKKREGSANFDLVEENVQANPEMSKVAAAPLDGTSMRLTVRTDLPDINFSLINEGVEESDDETITRLFEVAFLDQLVSVDVRLLAAGGAAAAKVLSDKQAGYVEAGIRKCCSQFWYGKEADPNKGFMGMIAQMKNDAHHVFDAEGTTADEKQSVFLMAGGREKIEWLLGNGRTLTFDPWARGNVKLESGTMDAMSSWMHFQPGARLANRNALLRTKNLTTQNGKTLTFAHLRTMHSTMTNNGLIPSGFWMTTRSRDQLHDSLKTEFNPEPPIPTEYLGTPFILTPNLRSGETF